MYFVFAKNFQLKMLSLLEMLRGVLSCGGGGEEDKKKICREIYEETGQNNPF